MKEYKVRIQRTYNTTIILKFPHDGRLHWNTIDDKLRESDSDLWDLIAEKELEQMDVSNETWKIDEINNTRTGALSPFTGPRDTNNKKDMNEELADKLTILIRDELAESQVNKENNSAEYRLGKNEAYSKILSVITTELQKIQKQWEQDH